MDARKSFSIALELIMQQTLGKLRKVARSKEVKNLLLSASSSICISPS